MPVLWVDLSPDEELLVLATLNPIAAMATTDEAKMNDLLAEVAVDDAGLARMLDGLGAKRPVLADPDAVPEQVAEWNVKPSDRWRLGDHRIPCGDATDPAALERLLDLAEPNLLATDPPSGVQRRVGAAFPDAWATVEWDKEPLRPTSQSRMERWSWGTTSWPAVQDKSAGFGAPD